MIEDNAGSIHRSFWLIGVVGLIFNLMGCANFILQMNADMVASMPEAFRSIVETRPTWGTGAFAVAVFGGALGCLLLLLKKSVAYYVLIASLLGAVVAQLPFIGMASLPIELLIGGLSQIAVTAFLIWYSKLAERKAWIS